MKKTIKTICSLLVCALLVFTLVSCSKAKQYEQYAEDIRVAAAKEEHKTYEDVVKKLGTPTQNATVSVGSLGATGVAIWYADCAEKADLDAKLEAGKEVPYISVTFANGKATDAKFDTAKPSK